MFTFKIQHHKDNDTGTPSTSIHLSHYNTFHTTPMKTVTKGMQPSFLSKQLIRRYRVHL